MSTTPPAAADVANCPHERGPGTTTCLRCRADAHRVAAAARRRVVVQALALLLGIGAVVALANRALTGRAGRAASPTDTATASRIPTAATAPARPVRARDLAPVAPLVGMGRTDLGAGMYVERTAGEVTVHFDTPVFRTRRPEKFEQVVRATLPELYGRRAQGALDAVAEGALVTGGDLLSELPTRGVALPPHDGLAISIFPGTRPGQDGPLAVRYRVVAVAAR